MIANDAPVADTTDLFTRIHPTEVVWDADEDRPRPSSGVFKKIDMSVHMGDVLQDAGLEPASTLGGRPNHSLAALTAGLVTSEEQ